jgi:hypothetical protein
MGVYEEFEECMMNEYYNDKIHDAMASDPMHILEGCDVSLALIISLLFLE